MTKEFSLKEKIKQAVLNEGFCVVGVCDTRSLDTEGEGFKKWIKNGFHGNMNYMENNIEKRITPELLVPNSKSVIVTALNYFPEKVITTSKYSIAKYAYGNDYHDVIKRKLKKVVEQIPELKNDSFLRIFTDSAPLLERSLAVKSGLGFIGKNNCLIIPNKGSFFLLGEIVTSLELAPDKPFNESFCGNCTKCLDACPTKALVAPKVLDARKCNSYLTQKKEENLKPKGNSILGCDICQDVCPHNKFAEPNHEEEFTPKEVFFNLTQQDWENLTQEKFDELFQNNALHHIGYEQLKRNIKNINDTESLI